MITISKASLFDPTKEMQSICQCLENNSLHDVGLTYPWMQSLWESYFGLSDGNTCIVRGSNSLAGIVPFYISHERLCGIPLAILRPITGLYSTRGGIPITGNAPQIFRSLLDYARREWRWDVFECYLDSLSAQAESLHNAANDLGLSLMVAPYEKAPYLTLEGTPDDILAQKSGNFRSNIKRKEKKLEKAGRATYTICTQPYQVNAAMNDILAIEQKSWKATVGSAITSSQRRMSFYRVLAERCAANGWLRIYLLKLDDVPIAFDYGLLFQQRYFMLKTSYDEAYSEVSPGVSLRWNVIKDLYSAGAIEHDFMWGEEPYKLQWANGIREYLRYRVYRRNIKTTAARSFDKIYHHIRANRA